VFVSYAILDEKTLQKIAKLRPSSEARLRNIDGVNQVETPLLCIDLSINTIVCCLFTPSVHLVNSCACLSIL
jgi:hypothetical protein